MQLMTHGCLQTKAENLSKLIVDIKIFHPTLKQLQSYMFPPTKQPRQSHQLNAGRRVVLTLTIFGWPDFFKKQFQKSMCIDSVAAYRRGLWVKAATKKERPKPSRDWVSLTKEQETSQLMCVLNFHVSDA